MTAFESWLITTLEGDFLTTAGPTVLSLLTDLASHSGSPVMQAADIAGFTVTAPKVGLSLGIELEQQLLSMAVAKLQAAMTKKPAPPSITS